MKGIMLLSLVSIFQCAEGFRRVVTAICKLFE